ncbi:MAG: flagellar biosynthesis protein FlgD [Planctomycetes bacterium]|nr:flagellar biosynthesis protein FlgD [Planctomycetota bacterium]
MSNTISGLGGLNGAGILGTSSAKFGENPFLQLLVTQMRSQTPLEPIDNQSFMQQMASFSSMEEQREMNDNLLRLLDFQGALARMQGLAEGSSLLGKEVTWTADGKEQSGTVDSVFVNDTGEVKLKVGEHEVDLRAVTKIAAGGQKE